MIIEGGEIWGAPFLINELRLRHTVAWMLLTPADASDAVALGNALAGAVNDALKATLLPQAMPFAFSVELLKGQLKYLGPFTVVCSNAHYNPQFQQALLSLHDGLTKVVLDVDTASDVPSNTLHLQPTELKLTNAEAKELVAGTLSERETTILYQTSRGAYATFWAGLQTIRGEPEPRVPAPHTKLVGSEHQKLVDPEALLDALLRLSRYVEALDLAAMKSPSRVPEVLKEAGPVYQEKGLLGRLYLLLQNLDAVDQDNEEVLSWLLVAAINRGEYRELLPKIEQFLDVHEAPSLRARYAATLTDTQARFREAQRAASYEPSPLTLFQLGRIHPNPEEGIAILTKGLRLAEAYGRYYEVARNAGVLAQRLIHAGKFEKAAIWSEWALRFFDQHQLKDGERRLRLLSTWAYSRLLIGESVGLDSVLRDAERALARTELDLVGIFRSTLAELELSRGNLVEAERLAADNLMSSPRRLLGVHAIPMVRVLLEKGDVAQAIKEGRRAFELTSGEDENFSLPAALALGMAQSVEQPEAACGQLIRVMNMDTLPYEYRAAAALHLLVGENKAKVSDVQVQGLKTIPLGGLKLLSGPASVFSSLWQELSGLDVPLYIKALGTPSVTLHNQVVNLSPRTLEILVVLALQPDGLTLEELYTALYEESQVLPEGLKVKISRLRRFIAIEAQPYRIAVPFEIDATKCEQLLDEGRLRAALELYQGQLLYSSDAPSIVEARGWLEERVRQAVLCSGDAEALYSLSATLKHDLELWEATSEAFVSGDPRVAQVRARIEFLQRVV